MRTVEIGTFLNERKDRFKPTEANTLGLKRIEKIDFSGRFHIVDNKHTKTNMILAKSGDLVISGINVEKGALGVYEGDEDVLATIHYSSYEYDEKQIDIEYLKWFLKSRTFQNIVKEQIGGGIKTELKPKRFLPLKIKLPELDDQLKIVQKINNVAHEIDELGSINNQNENLLTQLRKVILQEAVQGKLAPQNPKDEPASKLLKRIKAEREKLIAKGKIKKQKPLPPITNDEIPYELPKGWEWVRLGDVTQINPRNYLSDDLDVSLVPMALIEDGFQGKHKSEVRKWGEIKSGFTHFKENDVVVAKITPCFQNRKSAVMRNLANGYGAGTTELYVVRTFNETIVPELLLLLFKTNSFIEGGVNTLTGTAGQQRVKKEYIQHLVIGIPPAIEQKRIVAKVDQLMKLCDELETQLNQSKKESEMLMQAVLQEAFENNKIEKKLKS